MSKGSRAVYRGSVDGLSVRVPEWRGTSVSSTKGVGLKRLYSSCRIRMGKQNKARRWPLRGRCATGNGPPHMGLEGAVGGVFHSLILFDRIFGRTRHCFRSDSSLGLALGERHLLGDGRTLWDVGRARESVTLREACSVQRVVKVLREFGVRAIVASCGEISLYLSCEYDGSDRYLAHLPCRESGSRSDMLHRLGDPTFIGAY